MYLLFLIQTSLIVFDAMETLISLRLPVEWSITRRRHLSPRRCQQEDLCRRVRQRV